MERQTLSNARESSTDTNQPQLRSAFASSAIDPVSAFQQSVDNRAVQRLIHSHYIQAKLQIGPAGDQYEQEADQVADTVMRMPDPRLNSGPAISHRTQISSLHRKCTECEEEELQRQPEGSGVLEASSGVESQIQGLRGGGQPLPQSLRAHFEPRFGHDFSRVRVHTDTQAAQAARSVNAQAFTVGEDIAFGAGHYSPETTGGQRLLAHELTHVVQQGGVDKSGARLQRVCGPAAIGNPGGCEPFGTVATEQIFSVPTERFLFTVNCNDFATAAERTRLRTMARGLAATDPIDIHGFASEEGDATYNARLACSRATRVRDELADARTRAGLPALNMRDMYTHGATAFGARDINRSVVIPVAQPPTVEILPAGFIGPPAENQRRAAASCPINCDDRNIGTMHAMGLFFHRSRGPILPNGDPTADGIGTSLHFTETAIEIPATDPCNCDDYGIIQALDRSHPPAGRANPGIDNNGQNTPFYNEVFLSGEGIHEIPTGYPDEGERIQSTISIYDRPFIRSATWNAEACVACIKNGVPDRIFGCVTYGFTRALTDDPNDDEQVTGIDPGCRETPSDTFFDALRNDPTVADYEFEGR